MANEVEAKNMDAKIMEADLAKYFTVPSSAKACAVAFRQPVKEINRILYANHDKPFGEGILRRHFEGSRVLWLVEKCAKGQAGDSLLQVKAGESAG